MHSSPWEHKPGRGFVPVFHTSPEDVLFPPDSCLESKLHCPHPLGAFSTWKCHILLNNLHYLALPSLLPSFLWAVGGLGGQFPFHGFGFEHVVQAPKAVIKLKPSQAMSEISKHTNMSFFHSTPFLGFGVAQMRSLFFNLCFFLAGSKRWSEQQHISLSTSCELSPKLCPNTATVMLSVSFLKSVVSVHTWLCEIQTIPSAKTVYIK